MNNLTNLVADLREGDKQLRQAAPGTYDGTLAKAADEIERLRAALEKIALADVEDPQALQLQHLASKALHTHDPDKMAFFPGCAGCEAERNAPEPGECTCQKWCPVHDDPPSEKSSDGR